MFILNFTFLFSDDRDDHPRRDRDHDGPDLPGVDLDVLSDVGHQNVPVMEMVGVNDPVRSMVGVSDPVTYTGGPTMSGIEGAAAAIPLYDHPAD